MENWALFTASELRGARHVFSAIHFLSFMRTFRNNMGSMTEIRCLEGYIFLICAEILLSTKDIYQHFVLGSYCALWPAPGLQGSDGH